MKKKLWKGLFCFFSWSGIVPVSPSVR